MVIFPEPGYYEDGNFGIRLENVLVVNDAETEFNFGDKGYLQFEHITWVLVCCLLTLSSFSHQHARLSNSLSLSLQAPYQVKLINLDELTREEIDWLNTYHSKCKDILAPFMNQTEMEWLKKATEPVSVSA